MDTEAKQSMAEGFSRFFSVKLAKTDEDRENIYKIRYRVYCEEFKYQSVEHFPDELETDEYDQISKHCLILHKESNIPAGCVRLVPAIGPLPFEKYCSGSLDQDLIDSFKLERNTICEISRLAVDGRFRRRTGEMLTRYGMSSLQQEQEQRASSLIAVAGFLAATVLTGITNRRNAFAMMEPFLPRLMK